jgi:hypothetical protein
LAEGNHMRVLDIKDQDYLGKIEDYEGKENLLIENIENC